MVKFIYIYTKNIRTCNKIFKLVYYTIYIFYLKMLNTCIKNKNILINEQNKNKIYHNKRVNIVLYSKLQKLLNNKNIKTKN